MTYKITREDIEKRLERARYLRWNGSSKAVIERAKEKRALYSSILDALDKKEGVVK